MWNARCARCHNVRPRPASADMGMMSRAQPDPRWLPPAHRFDLMVRFRCPGQWSRHERHQPGEGPARAARTTSDADMKKDIHPEYHPVLYRDITFYFSIL